MHGLFHIPERWYDPLPSLKRVVALCLAALLVESFAFLLKKNQIPFAPIYLLGILRLIDISILVIWGPWRLREVGIRNRVRDALLVTVVLGGGGVLFLVTWKGVMGSPFLKLDENLLGQFRAHLTAFYIVSCLLSPIAEEHRAYFSF